MASNAFRVWLFSSGIEVTAGAAAVRLFLSFGHTYGCDVCVCVRTRTGCPCKLNNCWHLNSDWTQNCNYPTIALLIRSSELQPTTQVAGCINWRKWEFW